VAAIGKAVEHGEVSGDGLCWRRSQLLRHVRQMCQTGRVHRHGHIYTNFWHIYRPFDFIVCKLHDRYFVKMHCYQSSGFTLETGPLPAVVPPYPLHSQKLTGSICNFLGCQNSNWVPR